MLEDELGKKWRDEFIVWAPACGMPNLTRGNRFKDGNLFCLTLYQEDLRVADSYNKGATKFQYDFLSDGMQIHEPGVTAEDVLAMARNGELKIPVELVEALYAKKPIVFFGNPPCGQSGTGPGKDLKRTQPVTHR